MCYEIILSIDSKLDLSSFNCDHIKFIKEPCDIPESQILKHKYNWLLESIAGCSCTFRFAYENTAKFMADEEWMNEDQDAVIATKMFSEIVKSLLKQGSQLDCVISFMGDGYKFSSGKKELEIDLSKIDDSEFWFFDDHHLSFVI